VSNYLTGLRAEQQAQQFLEQKGYRLLAQRYRNAYGEIDLIMQSKQRLHFIEVKARRDMQASLYALQPRQQQRMLQCALGFLAEHESYTNFDMQCDLIAIADSQLEYIENILTQE